LAFLTNNFVLPPLTIARIYKSCWQVELFFKWIKRHLRIKAFHGQSENEVKTRIWIAVSIYALVAIVRKRLGMEASLYQILQILSLSLFEKKCPFYRHFSRPIPNSICPIPASTDSVQLTTGQQWVRTVNLNHAAAGDDEIDLVLRVWFLRHAGANFVRVESRAQRGNAEELAIDLGSFQVANVEDLHPDILLLPAAVAWPSRGR
jgi:Transposase DDE domain